MGVMAREQSGVRPNDRPIVTGLLITYGLFWIGLAAYALHLAWQTRRVRAEDGTLALRLFRSNREAGFVLLIAIILGAVWPV